MIINLSELNIIFIIKDGISLQVRKGGPWERRRCGAKQCKRHKHIINVFVFASIKSLLLFQAPNLNSVSLKRRTVLSSVCSNCSSLWTSSFLKIYAFPLKIYRKIKILVPNSFCKRMFKSLIICRSLCYDIVNLYCITST